MARPDAYQVEIAFASNPDDALSDQVWTDVSRYVDVGSGRIKIERGRSDELAQVQPSKMSMTLDNRDGRFTPDNVSSPYYPNVTAGKMIRVGIMRKGASKQVFDGYPGFNGSVTQNGWVSKPGQPVTTLATEGAIFLAGMPDSQSLKLTLPTTTPANAIVRRFVNGLVTGRQYTASIYIRVPTGVGAMAFGVSPGGTLATTINDSFQRRTITFTATSPTCELYVYNTVASTAGQLVYIDSVQVEEGSSATTFSGSGATFSWRFTGDVAEFPLEWRGGPALYAESNLTAVDRFGRLGELGEYIGTLEEDTLDDLPIAYYPLQETVGAVSAGDISGNDETPLTLFQIGSGGDLQFGQTVGIAEFYDSATTTVGFNPDGSNINGKYLRATLKTPTSTAALGATVVAYGREGSVPPPTGPMAILTAGSGSWFGVGKVTGGNMGASFYDATTGDLYEVASGFGLPSDFSAQLAAVLDIPSPGNGRIRFYYGGSALGTAVTFPMANVPSWRQVSVGGRAKQLFRGNLAHVSFYDSALSGAALNGQENGAFHGTDGAGNTTYSRLAKLCVYSNLGTLLWSNGGGTFTPQAVGGQQIAGNPIDAMRLIESTEGGLFYLKGDGNPRINLRAARYNAPSIITYSADRLDPDAITFRGDLFGVVNDVTVSSPQTGGATARVVNEASRAKLGRRKGTAQAVAATDEQARALAAWRANVSGTVRNRITGVRVSLLNDPALIASTLFLEPGSMFTITNLPSQAPADTLELYVEGWSETISETEWTMDFLTSPGEVGDVWQIGTAGRNEIGITTRIPL